MQQTGTDYRYEVRLVKIEGDQETEIERREVPRDKLEEQVANLPNREAMSLVNANVFIPVNLAAALNVLSDHSVAVAQAAQNVPTTQST